MRRAALALLVGSTLACSQATPPPVYQAVPVERRDIIVSARASGVVEPEIVVEVKSKASGEILSAPVETGQAVAKGTLMVRVDQRQPRNTLAQARSDLQVAEARVKIAESQRRRSEQLYKVQSIAETAYEQTQLEYANAQAAVVSARVAVENAQIAMDDTDVRAPIDGTIISKTIEAGQVISSPTRDVGGGTVLLRMADLNAVQVRTLVDETDIGKIRPDLAATVTVAAYPNQPFEGRVLKVEPQAQTEQNVTMFPVLVRIENRDGLLRPGMNCEVEVHVGQRTGVLAIPNAALRTERDAISAASVLGMSDSELAEELQPSDVGARPLRDTEPVAQKLDPPGTADPDHGSAPSGKADGNGNGDGNGTGDGRGAAQQADASAADGAPADGNGRRHRGRWRGRHAHDEGTSRDDSEKLFGGQYVVFALRAGKPVAVRIRTGLTDLDYSEVVAGLEPDDSVLILPSAGLVRAQQDFRDRVGRMTGGSGLPGMQSRTPSRPAGGGGPR